ncbi:kinase-like protein [Hymenopellis radicata]|nr:kinase-like protein [Hymenopellis radicata]
MQYLHSLDPCIIHKDIRGANILVGDDFRCYLTDFGISLVVETEIPGTSSRNQGNIRWLPPELIEESEFDPYLMREIDVYSFGCTLTEIYTGRPPYSNLRTDGAVVSHMAHIISRRPPLQPPTDILPSNLWDTVVVPCLAPISKDRPSAENILDALWTLHSEYLAWHLAARGAAYVRTSET